METKYFYLGTWHVPIPHQRLTTREKDLTIELSDSKEQGDQLLSARRTQKQNTAIYKSGRLSQ